MAFVVSARKTDLLRKHLKADAGRILFAELSEGNDSSSVFPASDDGHIDEPLVGRRVPRRPS
jgi:hypothetical protein